MEITDQLHILIYCACIELIFVQSISNKMLGILLQAISSQNEMRVGHLCLFLKTLYSKQYSYYHQIFSSLLQNPSVGKMLFTAFANLELKMSGVRFYPLRFLVLFLRKTSQNRISVDYLPSSSALHSLYCMLEKQLSANVESFIISGASRKGTVLPFYQSKQQEFFYEAVCIYSKKE